MFMFMLCLHLNLNWNVTPDICVLLQENTELWGIKMPMFSLVSNGMSNEQYFFLLVSSQDCSNPREKLTLTSATYFTGHRLACYLFCVFFVFFLNAGARFISKPSTLKHRGALVLTFNKPH